MPNNRIIVDVFPNCPPHLQHRIVNVLNRMAKSRGLYAFITEDKYDGDTRVEITAYDRVKPIDLPPGDLAQLLLEAAKDKGLSVNDLLKEAAKNV